MKIQVQIYLPDQNLRNSLKVWNHCSPGSAADISDTGFLTCEKRAESRRPLSA